MNLIFYKQLRVESSLDEEQAIQALQEMLVRGTWTIGNAGPDGRLERGILVASLFCLVGYLILIINFNRRCRYFLELLRSRLNANVPGDRVAGLR